MLSLFPRQASRRSLSRRWVRPQLEHLETRNCPACPVVSINSVSALPEAARLVHISGTVADNNPSACVVNLSGVVSGSVSVNSDGTFSADLTATGPGQITGVAQDTQEQLKSSAVSIAVNVEPPVITNFAAVHLADNTWTIQGDVQDVAPGGLPVVFGGPGSVQGSSVLTDSLGHFSLTVSVSTTAPSFTITAIVTDSWGLQSEQVSTICSNG